MKGTVLQLGNITLIDEAGGEFLDEEAEVFGPYVPPEIMERPLPEVEEKPRPVKEEEEEDEPEPPEPEEPDDEEPVPLYGFTVEDTGTRILCSQCDMNEVSEGGDVCDSCREANGEYEDE